MAILDEQRLAVSQGRINSALAFVREIERLKGIERQTRPVGLQRRENSAEHSWGLCMIAIALAPLANEDIHLDRVLKMLLIHDIGEIDAGDVVVFNADTPARHIEELSGVERVLGMLPKDTAQELIGLWLEFEEGNTPDSRFARGVDRVPGLLQNLADDGYAWRNNGITYEQAFNVNSRIKMASEHIWDELRPRLEAMRHHPMFAPSPLNDMASDAERIGQQRQSRR